MRKTFVCNISLPRHARSFFAPAGGSNADRPGPSAIRVIERRATPLESRIMLVTLRNSGVRRECRRAALQRTLSPEEIVLRS